MLVAFSLWSRGCQPPCHWVGRTCPGHHIPSPGDLFCGICHGATDCFHKFLNKVLHLDICPEDNGLHHGQVDALGWRAGLGQAGLPNHLWQASKASLWLWSRHPRAVIECTKALLGLQGKHMTSMPIIVIPTLPPPVYLGRQITFATILQTWV